MNPINYSFCKKNRIYKAKEIRSLFSSNLKQVSKQMVVFSLKNKIENHRIVIIVSKKVGNSVIRNRLKRYIRECFRVYIKNTKLNNFIDIAVILRKNASLSNFCDLCQIFRSGFKSLTKDLV